MVAQREFYGQVYFLPLGDDFAKAFERRVHGKTFKGRSLVGLLAVCSQWALMNLPPGHSFVLVNEFNKDFDFGFCDFDKPDLPSADFTAFDDWSI